MAVDTPVPPPETPVPPTNPPIDWTGIVFGTNAIGLGVFRAACLALLVLVIVVNLPGVRSSFSDFKVLRSFELILAIAGLGLIVSFMEKTTNAIAVVVGFMVVSALIIPTRDIIRFFLVATGSDRTVEQYFGSSSLGINISRRTADMAAILMRAVDKELRRSDITVPADAFDRLINIVVREIQRDRVLTLLERVKARGVFEMLNAIEANQGQEFLYRFAENDRLQEDLRFLRSEDLISLPYDDMTAVGITSLGRLVVRGIDDVDSSLDDVVDFAFEPVYFPQCSDLPYADFESSTAISLDNFSARYDSQSADLPQFVRLHVLPEEIGRYSVTFSRIGETDFDPKLALFSLGPTPSMPEIQSNCLAKESNDDENDFQLNSRISSDFLAGEYFIWLGIFGGSGPGQLVISRADTTQSIAENPPQSLEVEAAPPPAEEITPLTDPVPDVQTPPQP